MLHVQPNKIASTVNTQLKPKVVGGGNQLQDMNFVAITPGNFTIEFVKARPEYVGATNRPLKVKVVVVAKIWSTAK